MCVRITDGVGFSPLLDFQHRLLLWYFFQFTDLLTGSIKGIFCMGFKYLVNIPKCLGCESHTKLTFG